MFKKAAVVLSLAVTLASPAMTIHAASGCQFVLGFATLADMIPQQVGACADNESHNPQNGDALQHTTTGGVLVWRKADNRTVFTDGYHTWVNGPSGLQQRLNTERFPWEAPDAPAPAASPAPASPSPAAASPAQGVSPTLASIVVPKGMAPINELTPDAQTACLHMAQDLRQASTGALVQMQGDDYACPYSEDPNWPGFAA